MKVIRVGRRRINLEYLIMDEKHDGTAETAHIPQGGIRVTLESGIAFDLIGEEAAAYDRQVEEVVIREGGPAGPPPRSPVVGHSVPSRREQLLDQPGVPEQRKRGG